MWKEQCMDKNFEEYQINSDNPENSLEKDRLKMLDFASKLANFIINYKDEHSLTININGMWGSGKTTFVNFVKSIIKNNPKIYTIENNNNDFFNLHPILYQIVNIIGITVDITLKIILCYYLCFTFNINMFFKFVIIGFLLISPIKHILFLLLKPYMIIIKNLKNFYQKIKIFKSTNTYIFVDFIPWSYENIDSLIDNFIDTLKKECMLADKNLYKTLASYQEIIKEKSVSVSIILETLKQMEDNENNRLNVLKNKINKILVDSKIKFIITIDDIDRLTKGEINNICKLLKSVANFKNTIYLLPFDKNIVSKSLDENCVNGNVYLDKITNFNIDLKITNTEILKDFLLEQLEGIANKVHKRTLRKSEFDNEELRKSLFENFKINYSDNYHILFDDMFTNIRQIKRFLNQVNFLYISDEINVYDFLNLTALQYFYPQIYYLIYKDKILLCKEYLLFEKLADIKQNTYKFISEVKKTVTPNNPNVINITISASKREMLPEEVIHSLELLFDNFNQDLMAYTDKYSNKIIFIKDNLRKHVRFILDLLNEHQNNDINNELVKLKEHIDREVANLSIVLNEIYNIQKDKECFEKFIDKCSINDDKKDALKRFIINLFPNLNILYNNKYILTNDNLYLFRIKEDSLRDRRICNIRTFNNYFEYEQNLVTLEIINDIFNLRLQENKTNKYLEIYDKLLKIYKESYLKFTYTIEDGILYETSSFIGAGGSDFASIFKEYIKALILAYKLSSKKYDKYEIQYKQHPNHKEIIFNSILQMIRYIVNPATQREMFLESLNELINNPDIIQNIENINCLLSFVNDIQGIMDEQKKYQNRMDLTNEDLSQIMQNIQNRIRVIVPTNEMLNNYTKLPNFLYDNASLLGEEFLTEVLINIVNLNNERTYFIQGVSSNKVHTIFEINNKQEKFMNAYKAIYYWKNLSHQRPIVKTSKSVFKQVIEWFKNQINFKQ